MIVKFFARGAGGGRGPTEYLLGKDRNRDGATLLRGDADQTRELIDSTDFAKKYTAGVLSFEESDISDDAKQAIMDGFEAAMLPGLDRDQYDCLWVEHRDKGRLELNFVVPNVELIRGKRLNVYYDPVDRLRIDAWKDLANDQYGLSDPNSPEKQRALCTPSDLPRDKATAQQQLTDTLLGMVETGEITHREDIINTLQNAGFEVSRQTKSSISIADPEGGKPMRLKGALYERDFTADKFLPGAAAERERRYQASRESRLGEARERFSVGMERKRETNQQRYTRAEPEHDRTIRADQRQNTQEHTQELDGHDLAARRGVESGERHGVGAGLENRPPTGRDFTEQTGPGRTGSERKQDSDGAVWEASLREARPEQRREPRDMADAGREKPSTGDTARVLEQQQAMMLRAARMQREKAEKAAKQAQKARGNALGSTPRQPSVISEQRTGASALFRERDYDGLGKRVVQGIRAATERFTEGARHFAEHARSAYDAVKAFGARNLGLQAGRGEFAAAVAGVDASQRATESADERLERAGRGLGEAVKQVDEPRLIKRLNLADAREERDVARQMGDTPGMLRATAKAIRSDDTLTGKHKNEAADQLDKAADAHSQGNYTRRYDAIGFAATWDENELVKCLRADVEALDEQNGIRAEVRQQHEIEDAEIEREMRQERERDRGHGMGM